MKNNNKIFWLILVVVTFTLVSVYFAANKTTKTAKVGVIMPLTGPSASLGEWMKKGVMAAQSEINASGGINGVTLELVIEDDKCDGKFGVGAYRKLHDVEKVNYFAGPLCAASRLPVLKTAENDNSVLITTGLAVTYNQNTTAKTFNVLPSVSLVTNNVIDYAFGHLGTKKVSLLKVVDELGNETEAAFKANMMDRGINNPHVESFTKGTSDMRSEITKIMSDDSDTVFLSGFSTDYVVFMKQVKELGLEKTIISLPSIQTPDIAKANVGTGLVVYYSNPSATDSTSSQAFLKMYQTKDPTASIMSPVYLGSGYDAVKILASGMRKCGDDVQCSQNYISQLDKYPGANGNITFGAKGNINSAGSMEIRVLRDGAFSKSSK